MTTSTIIIAAAVVLAVIVVILLFNSMVGRKNRVQFAFAGIDTMLKKRFDLIPNLISTVERYMKHEREVLLELTTLRALAVSGGQTSTDNLVQLDNKLTSTIRSVFAMAENYPQLRASDNFLQLQGALNETEEQIAASRRAYNAAVTDYNNGCGMFPLSVVANLIGYHPMVWFEISTSERQNINIKEIWS